MQSGVQLPQRIEAMEAELETIQQSMTEPDFYRQDKQRIAASRERLALLESELSKSYDRWERLEALREGGIS